MIDLVSGACVGVFGVLAGVVGYCLGKRDGLMEEFRDGERIREILEFIGEEEQRR